MNGSNPGPTLTRLTRWNQDSSVKISDKGLALIKRSEGLRLDAYKDGGGIWTIGYGSTLGVHEGMTITPGEAERRLLDDLARHDITPLLDCPTNENQFAAMTSLAFNIGLNHFRNSTVLKRHKQGNYPRAADAFLLWKYDNGKLVPGLLKRRQAERMLYLGEL
jgi:lysozyme